MKIQKTLVCFVLTFNFAFLIFNFSEAGVGTTGAQFLKIGPSARALGMAGAFGAVSDDVYALHFNPSGLAQLKENEVSATYLRYFADINYGFIGYATPNTKIGSIGFGITYLIIDNIEGRGAQEPDERTEGYWEPERYFNAKDQAITFAYAKKNAFPDLLNGLDLGGNIRYIQSEIDQTLAYTASLDLSAMYSPVEKVKTTLAIQNISWGIKFIEETDPLPLNIKFAVAWSPLEGLVVACDLDEYIIDSKFYGSIGAEYWPIKHLALRAGYKYGYDTESLGSIVGLGVGIGFRLWNLGLDYAFVPFGDLGDTHRITFLIKF